MHRQTLNQRIGLTLSALSLTLLAACGGGGEQALSGGADPVVAQPASVTTMCGVEPVATSGPQLYTVLGNQPMEINEYEVLVTRLTSPGGYPFAGQPDATLLVPMEDLRNVSFTGYTPTTTDNRMGVNMSSNLAAGSVACVAGVSRINEAYDVFGNPKPVVVWDSAAEPSMPVGSLSSQPINGFEYIHNLATTQATAVFTMAKTELADPASATICRLSSAGADCRAPTVVDAGSRWTLQLPITQSGVYMLAAPPELVALH